ncbi:hypothetical protein JCM8097_000735 [Rhodosporidiobolus ruineniae]
MLASTLPLALAATLASTVAAGSVPHGHGHVARAHHAHRSFFPVRPALEARDKLPKAARMMKKVRRSAASSAYSTTAIWYAEGGWTTACGETLSEDDFVVGLPLALYPDVGTKSALCGEQIAVVNSATGANITATVVDASNRDDYTIFSSAAFSALGGDLDAGELSVTFAFANSGVDVPSSAVLASATKDASAHETPSAGGAASTAGDKKSTTSSAAPQTTQAAAPVKVAAVKTTSLAPTTTTTSAAPAATSSSSEDDGECDEDDDDCVCDDESSSSSAAAPSSSTRPAWTSSAAAAAQTTTTTSAAPQQTTTSSKAASTTTSSAYASTSKVADTSSSTVLAASNIQGFLGENTNAILSWYNTNSGQDSTNGNSWCGFPYDNSVPGFAPSLKTMLNNFGGDYEKAATAYCGLEAEENFSGRLSPSARVLICFLSLVQVTTPDGKTVTLYIADAFDDTWVLTPSSLDIIHGSFESLYGSYTDNKNDVVKNAKWSFTGNRNDKYKFKSSTSLS